MCLSPCTNRSKVSQKYVIWEFRPVTARFTRRELHFRNQRGDLTYSHIHNMHCAIASGSAGTPQNGVFWLCFSHFGSENFLRGASEIFVSFANSARRNERQCGVAATVTNTIADILAVSPNFSPVCRTRRCTLF